jgi:two-component system OmpR family sensor kinase
VPASAVLIVVFSIILYNFIKISIFYNINAELSEKVERVIAERDPNVKWTEGPIVVKSSTGHEGQFSLVRREAPRDSHGPIFETVSRGGEDWLTIYYPFESESNLFVRLIYNITYIDRLLENVLVAIFVVNFLMIFIGVFYAFFLSHIMLTPIKLLNHRLANMNESFIKTINTTQLPEEFLPLGHSLNRLIGKIQRFVKYQKEFFIGIAHELKTPLAVLKTKNEVTLIKPRTVEVYIDTLKQNIATVDEMNKMISAILEIGRQESAQFEDSVRIDIIEFLYKKANEFGVIAEAQRGENKRIVTQFAPKSYKINVQPTLLTHILQNFVSNACKFSAPNTDILIRSRHAKDGFYIEVLDEGPGIDESRDIFAPFKRFGNKQGAGLGLFLAKGAAEAMGVHISITNRTDDKSGAIATIFIPHAQKNQ